MFVQVTPPSAVDSKRPWLEEAEPWLESLKLRPSSAAPLGSSGDSLACVSVSLPLGASLRSVAGTWSRRFGASAVESTSAVIGKFDGWSNFAQLSKRQVLPASLVENRAWMLMSSPDLAPPEYSTERKPCPLSLNHGNTYWAATFSNSPEI